MAALLERLPFGWHPERRFLLRCELDVAFFHHYSIDHDAANYVMETFPIVKRKDEPPTASTAPSASSTTRCLRPPESASPTRRPSTHHPWTSQVKLAFAPGTRPAGIHATPATTCRPTLLLSSIST
jgi:hypothetical protein